MSDLENKFYVIKGGEEAEKAEEIETEIENSDDTAANVDEISEDELQKFYEENKDAIDLMGGLDMFESLLSLDEESFEELKPAFIDIFKETLREERSRQEILMLIASENYKFSDAERDFLTVTEAISAVDFLSEQKKDFLVELMGLIFNKISEVIGEEKLTIKIPCELAEGVQLPTYAHPADAGIDIYAREEITIAPGETKIISTGIKMAIPEGYAVLIQPRSGQSAKTKLRIANTPGLIDAGYRDEIGVIIENIEPPFKDIDYEFDDNGEIHIKSILHGQAYTIAEGQRFAQMRLVQVPKIDFIQVESVGEIGVDRNGGFGSSGI